MLFAARALAAELIALHDGAPLFSYRDGVAHISPEDRQHFEQDVLPGFGGKLDTDVLVPWLK